MEVFTIAEQLYYLTLKINTLSANGEQGSGTGFIYGYKSKQNLQTDYLFLVTNKHMIENRSVGALSLRRGKQSTALPLRKARAMPAVNDHGDSYYVSCLRTGQSHRQMLDWCNAYLDQNEIAHWMALNAPYKPF